MRVCFGNGSRYKLPSEGRTTNFLARKHYEILNTTLPYRCGISFRSDYRFSRRANAQAAPAITRASRDSAAMAEAPSRTCAASPDAKTRCADVARNLQRVQRRSGV